MLPKFAYLSIYPPVDPSRSLALRQNRKHRQACHRRGQTVNVQAVNDTSERDEAAVATGSINSKATEQVTVEVECNSNGNELEYTEDKFN